MSVSRIRSVIPLLISLLLGIAVGFGVGWWSRRLDRQAAPMLKISGIIDIRPDLKSRVVASDILFIIVTPEGETMPLAVKKIRPVAFPFLYTVGPQDLMVPGRKVEGPVALVVRLDKDGQANPPQPGDLIGQPPGGPVALPAADLHVLIDRVVGADDRVVE